MESMIGKEYFNGEKKARYLAMMAKFKNQIKEKYCEILEKKVPFSIEYCQKVGNNEGDPIVKAYKRYLDHKDIMIFEEEALNIKFHLSKDTYYKLLNVDKDNTRYVYSTIDINRDIRSYFKFKIYDKEININRIQILPVDCVLKPADIKCYKDIGIACKAVNIPRLEAELSGQMKIAVDFVKLLQLVDRTDNIKALVVGSSSQIGGGRSYALYNEMVTNSRIDLYDPREENDEYVTNKGNTIAKYAEKFIYTQAIDRYDIVQDDAFVNPINNRYTIDPNCYLSQAQIFSVKSLPTDRQYFVTLQRIRKKTDLVSVRQISRTNLGERRVMTGINIEVTENRDTRFGDCSFCLELKRFVRHRYGDSFFDTWASMHPSHINCKIKRRIGTYEFKGSLSLNGFSCNLTLDVDDSVCLPHDPVMDHRVVNSFDPHSHHTYVFSDVSQISSYMHTGKVAVRKQKLLKDNSCMVYYQVNYPVDIPRQMIGKYYFYGIHFDVFNSPKDVSVVMTARGPSSRFVKDLFLKETEWFVKKGKVCITGKESTSVLSSLMICYSVVYLQIDNPLPMALISSNMKLGY